MKKSNFIKCTLLCITAVGLVFTSCKKEAKFESDEKLEKDFIALSYDQQVKKMDAELAKHVGKTYKLSNITEFNADGTTEKISSFQTCAADIVFTMSKNAAASDNYKYLITNRKPTQICQSYDAEVYMEYNPIEGGKDYKASVGFPDPLNLLVHQSYQGVLLPTHVISNVLVIKYGEADSNGKFILKKEYSYIEVNN